jgi:hypothetical protein
MGYLYLTGKGKSRQKQRYYPRKVPQHTHPRGCLFLEKRKILTKKDGITAKKR